MRLGVLFTLSILFLSSCYFNAKITELSSTSFSLTFPSSAFHKSQSPVVQFTGISVGERLRIFSDSSCATSLSDVVASNSPMDVTILVGYGSYRFYAKIAEGQCLDTGLSYTADYNSAPGFPLGRIDGGLTSPGFARLSSSGDIFVSDLNSNSVMVFSTGGRYKSTFIAGLATPFGLVFDSSGHLFVVNQSSAKINKYNDQGTLVSQFGASGSGAGQFINPSTIESDASGNLYVVDSGNNRIQKFSSSGSFLSQFGTAGAGNGQFSAPQQIAFDGSGNIFVADYGNNRIQKFNSSGVYLSQFGSYGTGNGQFSGAGGIAIDSTGSIWVADAMNKRIQKFDSSGNYLSQFSGPDNTGNTSSDAVGLISADSNGNLLGTATGQVWRFNSNGELLNRFGSKQTSNGALFSPAGMALSSLGELFVADGVSNTIKKFSSNPSTP